VSHMPLSCRGPVVVRPAHIGGGAGSNSRGAVAARAGAGAGSTSASTVTRRAATRTVASRPTTLSTPNVAPRCRFGAAGRLGWRAGRFVCRKLWPLCGGMARPGTGSHY